MDLEMRYQAFDDLSKRFPCQRPSRLVSVYKTLPEEFERLRVAAAMFMSKCLTDNPVILDEEELLDTFVKRQAEIKNITPNGMIVPKRHTILEYNSLVRAFAGIINRLGIDELIGSWHIPLNLRIKFGEVSEENLKRHHPTEHIHSDSWAGESAESVTTLIPIFGDIARNHIRFYDPPSDFKEEWLGPRPTYLDGQSIAEKYSLVDYIPTKGDLILADFSSLHASTRLANAKTRVSIDTTFALKRPRKPGHKETIHPWRKDERATHEILSRLGEKHLFVFPDSIHQQVDSQGGFKHPTNLKLVEILSD